MKNRWLRAGFGISFVCLLFLYMPASLAWAEDEELKTPDVLFVATPHDVVDLMIRLADVNETDVVYDLGCGDGRIVIAAAKRAGARSWGYDIDPEMVKLSQENVEKENLEHLVTIELQDIFEVDLREASVIMLYLLPELNVRLIPQIDEMEPGSRIVSHSFDMAGVIPDIEATVNHKDGQVSKVYMWTTPLNKDPLYKTQRKGPYMKKFRLDKVITEGEMWFLDTFRKAVRD